MLVRTPISLWALLAAGLAARLLVVHWSSGIELILDEVNYLDYGAHLLENGRLPGAFRPPGYPGFDRGLTGAHRARGRRIVRSAR